MPYNMRPETFSIVHIFGSPLSFPMPLAISHFVFNSHISARDIWQLKQGRFRATRVNRICTTCCMVKYLCDLKD